jgi:hypothetical protein
MSEFKQKSKCSHFEQLIDNFAGCQWETLQTNDPLGKGKFGATYIVKGVGCNRDSVDYIVKIQLKDNSASLDTNLMLLAPFYVKSSQNKVIDFIKNAQNAIQIQQRFASKGFAPQILDAWICDQTSYIVMEKMDMTALQYFKNLFKDTTVPNEKIIQNILKVKNAVLNMIYQMAGIEPTMLKSLMESNFQLDHKIKNTIAQNKGMSFQELVNLVQTLKSTERINDTDLKWWKNQQGDLETWWNTDKVISMVHGDVHNYNIMLNLDKDKNIKDVKFVDFGLSMVSTDKDVRRQFQSKLEEDLLLTNKYYRYLVQAFLRDVHQRKFLILDVDDEPEDQKEENFNLRSFSKKPPPTVMKKTPFRSSMKQIDDDFKSPVKSSSKLFFNDDQPNSGKRLFGQMSPISSFTSQQQEEDNHDRFSMNRMSRMSLDFDEIPQTPPKKQPGFLMDEFESIPSTPSYKLSDDFPKISFDNSPSSSNSNYSSPFAKTPIQIRPVVNWDSSPESTPPRHFQLPQAPRKQKR